MKRILMVLMAVCLLAGSTLAYAASSADIQKEIDSYNEELSGTEDEISDLEQQIADEEDQIIALYQEIEAMNIAKQQYIDTMKDRIAFFYENSDLNSVIESLLGAGSFTELMKSVQYQVSLHEYDGEQLDDYRDLVDELNEKQEQLSAQVDALNESLAAEEARKASLEDTISQKETELEEAKEQEEALRRAAEEKARQEAAAIAAGLGASDASSYPQSCGGSLSRTNGVVYFNGHRETWYSQRVLPGNGLKIPGRHVEPSDGTIRDIDGYICIASSDLPKGTIVETSLGTGKVYDTGCASGTIDVYVDW